MWRREGGNEVNFIGSKDGSGGLRDREMSVMDGIERAAQDGNSHGRILSYA
jgi:hypothetical protein